MNKSKILIATALVCLLPVLLLFTGCDSILVTRNGETGGETIETRQFDFTGFTGVDIGGGIDYEISRADTFNISITSPAASFDQIEVKQIGDTLKIERHPDRALFNIGNLYATVTITMPQLLELAGSGATGGIISDFSTTEDMEIEVSGASSLAMEDISAADVTLTISGASKITGELEADDIYFDVSGARSIKLDGSANHAEILVSGASKFSMADFPIDTAEIDFSGASRGSIDVSDRLEVELSGSSNLEYTGEPSIAIIDISGDSKLVTQDRQ